ncbi:MAG: hypothetical protein EOM12_13465, partial [Verrucomicrobiae bacterium]|nr:hypothetical protein [Verrucomicrobiae bacterium]
MVQKSKLPTGEETIMTQEKPKNQAGEPVVVQLNVGGARPRTGCIMSFIMLIITGATLIGLGAAALAVFAPNLLTSIFSRVTGYETIQSRPVQG